MKKFMLAGLMASCLSGCLYAMEKSVSAAAEPPAAKDWERLELSDGRNADFVFPYIEETRHEEMVRWCNEHELFWLKELNLNDDDWIFLKLFMKKSFESHIPSVDVLGDEMRRRRDDLSSGGHSAVIEMGENLFCHSDELRKAVRELGVRVANISPPRILMLKGFKRSNRSVYDEYDE